MQCNAYDILVSIQIVAQRKHVQSGDQVAEKGPAGESDRPALIINWRGRLVDLCRRSLSAGVHDADFTAFLCSLTISLMLCFTDSPA